MTVKGRTLTQRQHRVGGKLDPTVHGTTFYPTAPVPKVADRKIKHAYLPGPPGAAQRALVLDYRAHPDSGFTDLQITTEGWWQESVTLNDDMIRFLRATLDDWFPPE